jgi:hypothetical protein
LRLSPSQEALISPKHHLHGGVDDVICRAANPVCVLLGSIGNEILKLIFALYDLWWLVNDWHVSSFSFECSGTRANRRSSTASEKTLGWSDPKDFLGG